MVTLTLRKDGHVCEVRPSDGDCGLDGEAIEARTRRIKQRKGI